MIVEKRVSSDRDTRPEIQEIGSPECEDAPVGLVTEEQYNSARHPYFQPPHPVPTLAAPHEPGIVIVVSSCSPEKNKDDDHKVCFVSQEDFGDRTYPADSLDTHTVYPKVRVGQLGSYLTIYTQLATGFYLHEMMTIMVMVDDAM